MKLKNIIVFIILFTLPTFLSYTFCISNQSYYTKYGAQDASTYFKKQINEFLQNFGVKKADIVPIKQFSERGKTLIGQWIPARCVSNVGIWLDENILTGVSFYKQYFILAHEAAHWVQSFIMRIFAPSKYREKDADIKAAIMLCKHNYIWVVEQYIQELKQEIAAQIGTEDDGEHPRKEEQVAYLEKVVHEWQKKQFLKN